MKMSALTRVAAVARAAGLDTMVVAAKRLVTRLAPLRSVEVGGLKYIGRFEHRHHLLAISQGRMEAITLDRFRRAIRPGAVVVDVGAYLGVFTLAAAEAVGPYGRVVAFEPAPATFACLSASVAANGFAHRVELVNAAAGDCIGTIQLALNADDPSQNTTVQEGRIMIEVPIQRITDVIGTVGVSVCKIDVEGAELAVLRGMEDHLDSISDLFVECNPAGLMAAGDSPDALVEKLERNAFAIDVIDEKSAKVGPWPMDLGGRSYLNLHAHR
jgi:FkbM family methyltransferase